MITRGHLDHKENEGTQVGEERKVKEENSVHPVQKGFRDQKVNRDWMEFLVNLVLQDLLEFLVLIAIGSHMKLQGR